MPPKAGLVSPDGPSLWNYAISRFGSISVFAPNCMRVRYRKSDCRSCQDICPENAISLDVCPEISSKCTECGLCVNACPTEVFADEDRHEQALWKQAERLHESPADDHGGRTLSISCQKAALPGRECLTVSCLGNLSSYFIAALAFLGYEELKLNRGACSDCHLKRGENLYFRSAQIAEALLRGTAHEGFIIYLEQAARAEAPVDRRRLFSPIVNILNRAQENAKNRSSHSTPLFSSGRKLFYHLLERGVIPSLPAVKYGPEMPWGQVAIQQNLCTGCGICAAVCPTGALVENQEKAFNILGFNSAFCFNCRLCSESCSQKAVTFEEEFKLAKSSPQTAQVVARIRMPECALCGDRMWAGGGQLCPTCERRQPTPFCIPVKRNLVENGQG
jgi:formate hydrogenlyase subunit 6/NADH:ubiquinone oxidoreductase subunit I